VVAGLAGLYPQIDQGNLRLLIAPTTGGLAAVLVWLALRPKSRAAAFGGALGLAAVLGAMNAVLPGVVLTMRDHTFRSDFLGIFLFAAMLGGPVGIAYGIPLATLVGVVHDPNRARSLDGTDQAKKRAAVWLALVSFLVLVLGRAIGEAWPFLLPAGTLVAFGIALAVHHARRVGARTAWALRVGAGAEPGLRLRPWTPEDDVALLPRFGDATRDPLVVVEWTPVSPTATAYRTTAAGTPIALVSLPREI
jgi:hypothetical protein